LKRSKRDEPARPTAKGLAFINELRAGRDRDYDLAKRLGRLKCWTAYIGCWTAAQIAEARRVLKLGRLPPQ
jgi:hypothetical protein